MAGRKKTLSREEAAELYRDLQKAMAAVKGRPGAKSSSRPGAPMSAGEAIAREISRAMKKDDEKSIPESRRDDPVAAGPELPFRRFSSPIQRGQAAALSFVLTVALVKVCLSAIDASGIGSVQPAEAAVAGSARVVQPLSERFSREEVQVLTTLDARRAELEERNRRLEERGRELDARDREFAARMTRIKELTDKLTHDREKNVQKRSAQIEQLANVYGSMNPEEAAKLIEQLDVTIALALIEKMPEKRIGQILAMMSPERALALTKLLSGRIE